MCSPKKSSSCTSKNRLPEQPPETCWNDTSTYGEGIDESHTAETKSILGKTVAASGVDNILGRTLAATEMITVRELRPRGTAKGSTDWYKMCTETLGSESLGDVTDLSSLSMSISTVSASSRMSRQKMRANTDLKDFPPFLSTLKSNGRPRFSYEKERSDGRLTMTMTMVANDTPEIVRRVDVGDSGELELNVLARRDEEDMDQD